MPQPDVLEAQLRANRATAAAVRARVLAFVAATWYGLGSWNVPDVERFVALALPIVLGGQRTIASLTDSYLALLAARAFGGVPEPVGVDTLLVTGAALRNGTDPELVYRRGGAEVWDALGAGDPLSVAVERGAARLASVTSTDLQLAKTHTARQVLTQMPPDRKPTGYVRTLEGPSSCGFCALASTRLYHVDELLPIHPACDCGVEPYYGDPQLVVDPGQLEQVHRLAAEFFGSAYPSGFDRSSGAGDYHDFVIVHEHGELGPVLARKASTSPDPRSRQRPDPATHGPARALSRHGSTA